MFWNGCLLAFESKRLPLVTLSTAESEYVEAARCASEVASHVKSVRLINGTLGGSVSARVANRGLLARPAQSLVHRGPGERRVREGAG